MNTRILLTSALCTNLISSVYAQNPEELVHKATSNDFAKRSYFNVATEAANARITSIISYLLGVSRNDIDHFSSLITNGDNQAYEAATEAARVGATSRDSVTRSNSLWLFGRLIRQKYEPAYGVATEAAKAGMSWWYDAVPAALDVFQGLVAHEHEQAYEPATEAAKVGVTAKESWTRARALELFAELVDNGYEPAYGAAAEAASNAQCLQKANFPVVSNRYEQEKADEILTLLKQKNFSKATIDRTTSKALYLYNASLKDINLFEEINGFTYLVDHGCKQVYEAATLTAKAGMNTESWSIKCAAIGLLRKLVANGHEQAYEIAAQTATYAAKEGLHTSNGCHQNAALYLFSALVDKGYEQAYEAAAQAAKTYMTSRHCYDVQRHARKLLAVILSGPTSNFLI